MIRVFLLLAAAFLLVRPGIVSAQSAGEADLSFQSASLINGTVRVIVPAVGGKVYIGGEFTTVRGAVRNQVARLNSDGSVDDSFDPDGGANNQVECLAIQPDGKVIIGGWFTSFNGTARSRIARLNADGSLDTSFDPGSGTNGVVTSLALQGDGKLLIGGWFTSFDGVSRNYLARLNSNGSLDTSFDPGTGASSGVLAVIVAADGKILIGGHFTSFDGIAVPQLTRLLSDGNLDPAFDPGAGANGVVSSMAVQTDGKILVGGSFTSYSGTPRNRIARIETDGSLDSSFDPGTGANGTVNSISLRSDGKVLVGGWFTGINGTSRGYVARLNGSGELDSGFDPGSGAQSLVFSVASLDDGKSLIGGQFKRFDGLAYSHLVRVENNGEIDTGLTPDGGRNGAVSTVAFQSDGKAILAGDFTSIGSSNRNRVARILADGSLDPSFDPGDGADGSVESVAILSDGKVIVAGDFTGFDGVARGRIARLNGDGSLDPGFATGIGADELITSLAVQADGKILIVGNFTSYNGVARGRIARLNADGSLDVSFDPGVGADAVISSVALQPDGKVVIAGDFTSYAGDGFGRIARLNSDGSVDATFDQVSLADGLISSVVLQPDGKLLIAGDFTTYDGVGRERVARLNGNGGLDLSFDPGSGVNGRVSTMALQADGKVILGGTFALVDGANRQNLARINGDGSIDTTYDIGDGSNGPVYSVVVSGNGRVLIGGDFTIYRGVGSNFLMRTLNDTASATFSTETPVRLEWLRGGAAPEVEQAFLEFSTDSVSWIPLGAASRISGGWEVEGLNLPKAGFLRARGRGAGGFHSGSSSILEQVAPYALPPEIVIEQPTGVEVTNGAGQVDFGTLAFGGASERTFTIRNMGYGDLSDIELVIVGADADDFSVTSSPDALVLPGGSTTFSLDFAPANAGSKSALLQITSNDEERSPYEISLVGIMQKGPQTITFNAIADQLATAMVGLSATGGASGIPVDFTIEGPAELNGATLSFTGPGLVTVTANQAGNTNYDAASPVVRSFNVTAVPATVMLGNLTHVYDGTVKTATATTVPEGLPVLIDYGGPAPVPAGNYPISAAVTDPRYSGATIGTLVIAKASQTIAFAAIADQLATATVGLSATGGASGNPVVFSATGPAQIDGNNVLSFTGPGSVTVRANQAGGPNHEAAPEVARTFDVEAATATIVLADLHQVADGTAREVLVTTTPPGLEVNLTYDGNPGAPTTVGDYVVAASLVDARYQGSGGGTLVVDDPSRLVSVVGGSLPALSALGALVVPSLQVGAYEVTGSHWMTVVAWAEAEAGYDFDSAGTAVSGDHPVTGVNWFDAVKWCNARTEWENALSGKSLAPAYRIGGNVFKAGTPSAPGDVVCDFGAGGYRLPTAVEWEFAARGGSGGSPSLYPGGDSLEALGWYTGNSGGATHPAGGKSPNGLDLYDLAGNAAEWTWDPPSGAPAQRLLRGGTWSSPSAACELAALSGESPSLGLDRSGFRLARSVSLALAAALDGPGLEWETGGAGNWFAQTATAQDGVDAAESATLSQGQASWLETQVEGPGNLRFRVKTQGTEGQDVLTFLIDGNGSLSRSGAVEWEEQFVEIETGVHTVRWNFARGSDSGMALAWLDTLAFEPATPPSVSTLPAASVTGTGATLGGEVSSEGGREVTVRGVVYAATPLPTLENGTDLPAAAGGIGSFTVNASGLTAGTTYFVRAYATNNLGTTYGNQVVFTSDKNVVFNEGVASYSRDLLPGDRHRYNFTLSGPRFLSLASSGGAALRSELRNSDGEVLASFEGDADFALEELLFAGGYVLEIYRQDGSGPAQGYVIDFDATVVAATRPDVATGASAVGLIGRDVFTPGSQSVTLTSVKAKPVTAFAELANRGNLPDVISARAPGGNSLFNVVYSGSEGNITAGLLAGTYRTGAIGNSDEGVLIRVTVSPNKKKLTKKKGKRTKILKKSLILPITAASSFDPSLQDSASIKVQTR